MDIEGELNEVVYGSESMEMIDEEIQERIFEVKDDYDDGAVLTKECPISPNAPYICNECGKIFSLKRSYEKHLSSVHRMRKIYHCKTCPSKFYNFKSFRRHYALHNSKNRWDCSLCEMHFERKENGERHLCNTHQIYKIECELCGKGFAFRAEAIEHLKMNHSEFDISGCRSFVDDKNQVVTLNYNCKECDSSFLTQQQLTAHEKMSHLEPIITNRSLRRPKDRKKVIRLISESSKMRSLVSQLAKKISDRNNPGSNSKICKVCKKTFNSSWHLNRHLKVHFGTNAPRVEGKTEPRFENGIMKSTTTLINRPPIKPENGITKKSERGKIRNPKTCHLCKKFFTRNFNFKRHMKRIHHINIFNSPQNSSNIVKSSPLRSSPLRNSPRSSNLSKSFVSLPSSFSTPKNLNISSKKPNNSEKFISPMLSKPLTIRKPAFLNKTLPKRIPEVKVINIVTETENKVKKPVTDLDPDEMISLTLPEISIFKVPLPEDESQLDFAKLKPNLCKICGVRYTRKIDLDHHVESKHFNKCSYCNLMFSERLFLQNHLRNQHLDKLFVCSQCEKIFLTSYHLDQHTRYVHLKAKNRSSLESGNLERYQCPKCFKILSCASGLRRHRRNVHKEEIQSPNI